jgi:hypothetical protein
MSIETYDIESNSYYSKFKRFEKRVRRIDKIDKLFILEYDKVGHWNTIITKTPNRGSFQYRFV